MAQWEKEMNVRTSLLGLVVVGFSLGGCNSLLGSYEIDTTVTPAVDSGIDTGLDAGTDGPPPSCTVCNSQCVDTNVDNANCGRCGIACTNGQTCQSAKCACPTDQVFCGGQCAKADRQHCGVSCTPCQVDEVCNTICTAAPSPAFKSVPLSPTGWLLAPAKAPLTIAIVPTNIPGALYECRTGPAADFTPTDPPWGPCDGATGSGTTHTPQPKAATPEGTYKTEYRYRSDTYRSPTISTQYYVHHALDNAATCPRPGQPADGPHFTDEQYFEAARQFSLGRPAEFPITDTFAAPSLPPAPTDEVFLVNPFIKVTFRGVAVTSAMFAPQALSTGWPSAGGNYVLNERNLRHRYVLAPARNLLVYRRLYAHPQGGACTSDFLIGDKSTPTKWGPLNARRGRQRYSCEAMVLNSHGAALCISPNAAGTAPEVKAIDEKPNVNGLVYGVTASLTANSNVATLSGNLTGMTGKYLQIPSVGGHWYQVTGQPAANKLTLGENATTPVTNAAFRDGGSSLLPTYVIPTGYAKLQEQNHAAALGLVPPRRPSFKTKCEAPGCNTGKPWLTYLPP